MDKSEYLIDTNSVIDYLGNKLPSSGKDLMDLIIDKKPIVSVISKIEVLGYNSPKEHYKVLEEFISDCTILNLNEEVVNVCIEIRKKYKTKLPDALIAATAIVHDLVLITRNISDFKNINELKTIDPHHILI